MDKKQFKAIMEELASIRKLLILCASKSGATSDEIGKVIGVGGSAIRNILAGRKLKRPKMEG
jgi:hypothetical protein